MAIQFMKNNTKELKPNVFMQETEPETKEGIWIQANKNVEKIKAIESFVSGNGEWNILPDINYSINSGAYATVGKNIYIFGNKLCLKFNTEDLTCTTLDNDKSFYSGCATVVNGLIYLFGGTSAPKAAYRYNTDTNEYVNIASIPIDVYYGFAVAHDTDIYLFMGEYIYKYDTINNEYTLITNKLPFSATNGTGACIGNNIFIFINTSCYRFDIESNEITQLNSNIPFNVVDTRCVSYNTFIYLFGSSDSGSQKKAYRYNTATNTFMQLDDIPHIFQFGHIGIVENIIYIIGGVDSNKKVSKFVIPMQEFENNTLIISQANALYKTQLYENEDIDGRLLYSFDDVKYNTTEDGLDDTLPTYYGTGTEWIKFKN